MSQLKIFSDGLQNFINHPNTDTHQILEIVQYLKQLCEKKVQLKILPQGYRQCAFCFNPIQFHDKDQYVLSCNHCTHKQCLEKKCQLKDPNLRLENLTGILCNICGIQLQPIEAYSGIRKIIIEEINLKNAKVLIILIIFIIKEIDRQLAEENKLQAVKKTFDCSICFNALSVNQDCITLECDHRACKGCLTDYLTNLIENGQVQADDLICPEAGCKKQIDQSIIYYVVTKEIFDKYLNFGFTKLTGISENQVFVRCPTADCNMIFEYDKTMKETRFTCPVCNKKFCALGCDDPHEGSTCEQYKQWQIDNGKAQQEFDLIVQQQKIRKCKKNIFYIVYFCKVLFVELMYLELKDVIICYVCSGPWLNRKCGHSYYDPAD